MKNTILNWSGGKDCAISLMKFRDKYPGTSIKLLTTFNAASKRVSMHGVRKDLISMQAESIGIDIEEVWLPAEPDNKTYEKIMGETMAKLKLQGYEVSVFGDIFLEDLRHYRESQLKKAGIKGIFPLWKMNTSDLAREFISKGFKAVIVSADDKYFTKDILGTHFDDEFLDKLPENADPCGENGEFHTFVYQGPGFKFPVNFRLGDVVYKKYPAPAKGLDESGFWFIDLLPVRE